MRDAREEFNKNLFRLEDLAKNLDSLLSSIGVSYRELQKVRTTLLKSGEALGLDPRTTGIILDNSRIDELVAHRLTENGLTFATQKKIVGRPPQKTLAELVARAQENLRSHVELHDRAQRRAS